MRDEPRNSQTRLPRWRRTVTVLVAASLIGAACASENEQVEAESSVRTQPVTGRGDVEYGASLEEWSEAVDSEAAADPDSDARPVNDYPEGYEEVEWEDLLPAGYSSDEIYARYADRLNELDDGSPEADEIYAEMQAEYDATSDAINSDLDGAKINLAGFVAPLNFEDDVITEFLLVPYFGACIHVPAPPSNQTVLVKVDEANGLSFDDSWGAIWVAGTLTIDPISTDLATASYRLTDATSGVYDEYS
ncbi:MAG: DUF3299 domain-containing protein [Acidimicrobiales bacterium]